MDVQRCTSDKACYFCPKFEIVSHPNHLSSNLTCMKNWSFIEDRCRWEVTKGLTAALRSSVLFWFGWIWWLNHNFNTTAHYAEVVMENGNWFSRPF